MHDRKDCARRAYVRRHRNCRRHDNRRGIGFRNRNIGAGAPSSRHNRAGHDRAANDRPGDLVLFSSTDYRFAHVAIYAGTVRGEDFVVHCTYKRGVEFNTLSAIADPYKDPEIPGSKVYAIYHLNGNT